MSTTEVGLTRVEYLTTPRGPFDSQLDSQHRERLRTRADRHGT
jgi:hypothetical protein